MPITEVWWRGQEHEKIMDRLARQFVTVEQGMAILTTKKHEGWDGHYLPVLPDWDTVDCILEQLWAMSEGLA